MSASELQERLTDLRSAWDGALGALSRLELKTPSEQPSPLTQACLEALIEQTAADLRSIALLAAHGNTAQDELDTPALNSALCASDRATYLELLRACCDLFTVCTFKNPPLPRAEAEAKIQSASAVIRRAGSAQQEQESASRMGTDDWMAARRREEP